MSDSKKKIYLGEDLVCQTFTDAEEQAKAFDLFGLEQPVVSSNAPASTRPVQQGQVCEFDGVNDYVLLSGSIGVDFSGSCWIKFDEITTTQGIYNHGNDVNRGYVYLSGGALRIIGGSSVVFTENTSTITPNVWHFVEWEFVENSHLICWVDGVASPSVSLGSCPSASGVRSIGTHYSRTTHWLNGSVSNFIINDNQYNLNHASGTTAYDSSGNGNDGTLQNGAAFVVDNTLPPEADKLNLEGYTDDSGVLKPRDESDPENDIDGNPLQYSGSVYPRRPEYRNSYAASFDGVDDYISAAHLTGSETVTSSEGTSTPSISAGRIDFTSGTCSNLILSDGTQYPLAEGAGNTVYDISGNGNHGTINNASTATEGAGFWAGRIDGEDNALNNNNGFSKRMLFDGGQYVATASSLSLSGNFSLSFTAICTDISARRGLIGYNSNNFIRFNATTQLQFRVDGSNYYYSIQDCTVAHSYRLERTGTDVELFIDGVSAGSNTISSNFTINRIGAIYSSAEPHKGLIYNINLNNQASYNGYGNTDADWIDQIGSNNGTVNGSPALLRIPADTSEPTKDVFGDTLTNPAITDGYNGAETELDAYNIAEGDNPSPATNNNPDLDAIEFGTDFASNDAAYMRLKSSTENDRLITFEDDLTGGDETLAQKYTQ